MKGGKLDRWVHFFLVKWWTLHTCCRIDIERHRGRWTELRAQRVRHRGWFGNDDGGHPGGSIFASGMRVRDGERGTRWLCFSRRVLQIGIDADERLVGRWTNSGEIFRGCLYGKPMPCMCVPWRPDC